MHSLPDDYYLSDQENIPYDLGYGIRVTQPHQPLNSRQATDAENSTTETDSSFGPPVNEYYEAFLHQQLEQNTTQAPIISAHPVEEEEHDTVGDSEGEEAEGLEEHSAEGHLGNNLEVSAQPEDYANLPFSFSINSLLHTPPWLRAEEAGMSSISPWRQTCDISPSHQPPPSRHPRREKVIVSRQ